MIAPDAAGELMYLTRRQVAAALQVSERTVVDMAARGMLPKPWRPTRKLVRWLRADIEALAPRAATQE